MKTWQKFLIIFVGGGLVWGLAYASSIWSSNALIFASLSSAVTAGVAALTGFTPNK